MISGASRAVSSVYAEKCYPYAPRRLDGGAAPTALPANDLTANREGDVTAPLTPGLTLPPAPPPLEPVFFPLTWFFDHASAPLQYRATADVARLSLPNPRQFGTLPYTHRPALLLAVLQQPDGTWGGSMLGVPASRAEHFEGLGTISAVRRLLEWGWDRESPPLLQARRILFRLLAEDEDPGYLFELAPRGKPESDVTRHGRAVLREAAAAALAQAGYENDPRLRGCARRAVERLDAYLRSPIAQKPFVRSGNQHVLAPEAAPPSVYALLMLAYMPLFRSEHYGIMDRLYAYVTQAQPRQTPAVVIGSKVVAQPQLVLGDPLPHRNAVDADLPAALFWLELFARLGFLKRNDGWMRLFERFLDDRDELGVWRPPRRTTALRSANPVVWPSFPLDGQGGSDDRIADITFRIGLIARHAGRPITLT